MVHIKKLNANRLLWTYFPTFVDLFAEYVVVSMLELTGVCGHRLKRFQSVLSAAARRARRSEHITPSLRHLHRMLVPERIMFCSGGSRN